MGIAILATPAALGVAAARAAESDATFVKAAASGGMLEVELGKVAVRQASSPDVTAFGERMVTDHTKAGQELAALARTEGLSVPSKMDEKDLAELNELSKLHGAAFDKAYMDAMVKDHEQDVAEFRAQAALERSDVDRWAAATLPTLESHLAQARTVDARVVESQLQ
jgi:putative membrane protein